MYQPSRSLPALALAAMFLGLAGAGAAQAACGDLAAPGVNWRRCLQDAADLDGVDLTGAQIIDTSFTRASLKGAVLANTHARQARFVSADLSGANLSGADLFNADFTRANLSGADLSGTQLRRTRFFGANLRGANLSGALLEQADFLRADLSGARWVDGHTICAEGSESQCRPMPASTAPTALGQ